MKTNITYFTLLLLLSSCGGSSDAPSETIEQENREQISSAEPLIAKLAIPDNRENAEYKVLMIGNSHTSSVSKVLKELLKRESSKTTSLSALFGSHLDNTLTEEENFETFDASEWSHVILQGQKYSQSQAALYPTSAAKFWITKAKNNGSTPILFPEHPQNGNKAEAVYVHNIHVSISSQEPSCVAPVGLAWDLALSANPNLALYSADGNHASSLGALLSSFVFYEVITGLPADLLSYNEALPGNEAEQSLLRQMATQAITENEPCQY